MLFIIFWTNVFVLKMQTIHFRVKCSLHINVYIDHSFTKTMEDNQFDTLGKSQFWWMSIYTTCINVRFDCSFPLSYIDKNDTATMTTSLRLMRTSNQSILTLLDHMFESLHFSLILLIQFSSTYATQFTHCNYKSTENSLHDFCNSLHG